MEQNLLWLRVKWGEMVKILGIELADRRTVGIFYVAVVQLVLFFRLETWVVTPPAVEGPRGLPPPGGLMEGRHGP